MMGPELDQMRQGNVQVSSEAQTPQRVRDLVKLALVADQQTRVLLMREAQSSIEARGRNPHLLNDRGNYVHFAAQ